MKPDPDQPPATSPALTPRAAADLAARQAREAKALRDNLARRKQQTRKAAPVCPTTPE